MQGPSTYSQWVILLERFGKGDDSAIPELAKGSFVLDAGTSVRFYTKMEETYKARKQSWLDKFQRSFQWQNFKHDDEFGMILREGRQNLLPLLNFISIAALPDDLRKILRKDIEDFVEEIRGSLKKSIAKIKSGGEKMLMALHTFTLPGSMEHLAGKSNNNQPVDNNILPGGRKIIF